MILTVAMYIVLGKLTEELHKHIGRDAEIVYDEGNIVYDNQQLTLDTTQHSNKQVIKNTILFPASKVVCPDHSGLFVSTRVRLSKITRRLQALCK